MDYSYTEEQIQLRERAKRFAAEFIAPEALAYDRKGVFPFKTVQRMGEADLFSIIAPAPYGGLGLTTLEYGIVQEEIGAVSPAYTHNGQFQAQKGILLFGSDDQKATYLPELAKATSIGAIAISEHQAGSSFKGMETRALYEDGRYILNGHKTHINDAAEAHVMLLLARTSDGFSVFIIEKDTPGVVFTKKLDPIGLRSSPVYEFKLQNVGLTKDYLLGEEGCGLQVFFGIFNFSRIGNASVLLGIARGALNGAVAYCKERDVGGSSVVGFQGIRWIIADMAARIDAAELLRNRAALLESSGTSCARETCIAKYFAGEVAREVTNKAIEITGSFGCYRETPYEMWLRDAKALLVAGGSSEIMKNVIADLEIGK